MVWARASACHRNQVKSHALWPAACAELQDYRACIQTHKTISLLAPTQLDPCLHCKDYRVSVTWEVVWKAHGAGGEEVKTNPISKILTVSPILSPMHDLSPGMTSSLRQVALKARDSSSGRSRTSSSTLERIF